MSSGLELKPASVPPEIDWTDEDGAVEAMVEWFFLNFEDPAHHTPYESAEGGYQYIWGGPYDAKEELWDAFPDAPEELIERAADEIQSDGLFDWVPSDTRIQPDDEPDGDDYSQPLEARLEALGGQLDRIEQHIAYWRNLAPQMGHNGPPDEFRLEPDDEDLAAAEASVAEVRVELAKPDRANTANAEVIEKAEGAFKRLAKKIFGWIKVGAVTIVISTIGGIGKHIGEEIAKDPQAFWNVLVESVGTLAQWAMHLVGMF